MTGPLLHHMHRHETTPGRWVTDRPPRYPSRWAQWRRERRCRRDVGHCWHNQTLTEWWCCICSAETDGRPPRHCAYCLLGRPTRGA